MAAYIAMFISLVCLILLTILLIRFKKLFSTESIIEKTRNQMSKMISDINNNANRDIELINDSSRRLRALLAESEHKMEQYKEAADRLRQMISLVEKMHGESDINPVIHENPNVSNIKSIGQKTADIVRNTYKNSIDKSEIDPNAMYKVTQMQSSLFDEENVSVNFNINENPFTKDEINVTSDGAAYKEVPVITTKIFDEKPIINKKEKENRATKENIKKLFMQGYQVEEIAQKLSCQEAEVQFIIDTIQR